jgi:hypothetical protein
MRPARWVFSAALAACLAACSGSTGSSAPDASAAPPVSPREEAVKKPESKEELSDEELMKKDPRAYIEKVYASTQKSIGYATMDADGTIVLHFALSNPPAHGQSTYRPDDPEYQDVLRHLGGLKPGETKSVPPFPED